MTDTTLTQRSLEKRSVAQMGGTFDPLFGALMDDGWFPSPAHVFRRAAILDAFAGSTPGRLLEMGCGAGRLIVDWARFGHRGEACDLDPESRLLADHCATTFATGFAVREAPQSDGFDYLVATEVLEHVEEPSIVLEQWLAHLRPGGTILLTVPAFQERWGASDEWAGHVQRFEPEEFRRLIETLGLTVTCQRLYGFPVGDVIRMIGNRASARRIRARSEALDRVQATLASGRDRRMERSFATILRSPPVRAALRTGVALQRRFDRGHGLLVIARK